MKTGIIGAGFMGSMHARILKELPGAGLAGITALTEHRARKIAEELSVPYYSNYEELLADRSVEIVDICTPTETHARIACECMAAGKHVIVEFPVCSGPDELQELRKTSEATGRVCAVACYTRFQSQYTRFFEIARSGQVGKINSVYISRRSSSVFAGSDIVNNLLAQDIDSMVSLLGKPDAFSCVNSGQDMCVFVFDYDGIVAVIEGATNMHDGFPFTTRHIVSGDRGCIDLEWRFIDRPEYLMRYSSENGCENVTTEDYDPYQRELELIVFGIGNGTVQAFDIHSVYDSAMLSFSCRSAMR